MGTTTITISHKARAFRFPRCDSVPSVSSRTTTARALLQWKQPTSQSQQGKAVPIPSLLIPFPLLAVGSWLVSSESSRSNHGNDVPAMGATDITEPTRQGRSDSLVADSVPSVGCWFLARSLCEIREQPRQGQPSEQRQPFRNCFRERDPTRQGRSG